MKTLVTGATGFVGKHLVKRLVEEKRCVTCLVRETSDIKPLERLGVKLVYGDLLDKNSLWSIMGDEEISVLYHLAGAVYSRKSRDYHKVNVTGTKNLLEVCKLDKIKKFILLSSITAVGPQSHKNILLNESTVPNPIPPYGSSKYGAEQVALTWFNKYSLPLVIVRPPLVYGPEQSRDMTDFFSKIDRGLFRIVGDGAFITSLCYIDNLIDGLLLTEKSENSIGAIYFLADDRNYTFKEISETIAEELGVRLSDFRVPTCVADMSGVLYKLLHDLFNITSITLYSMKLMTLNFGCDISKARRELSYHPSVDFKEGLRRTVEWYKRELGNR